MPHNPVVTQGDEGFGLYIHWPFCLSKCPYCDFNSHAAEVIDQTRWRTALLTEMDYWAAQAGARRPLTSIFFGGGTPSLMDPATTAALIERAKSLFTVDDALEITLEANPSTVDQARFEGFREAGVNRVSLGVQALDDRALRFLERRHDAGEAMTAVATAQRLFPRVSFDLIYARPGQTAEDWRHELRQAIALSGGHLSLYQLTIEQGTRFFGDHARGDFALPDEDTAVALWDITQEETSAAGLAAYEVSNHARPGDECRHNLVYWRGGDYIGIGPGAHGRVTLDGIPHATRQHRAPEKWLEMVAAQGHATRARDPLDPDARAEELVLMGLRLSEGVDAARFERLTGRTLDSVLDASALTFLRGEGLIEPDAPLRTTAAGRLTLNSVIAALLGG